LVYKVYFILKSCAVSKRIEKMYLLMEKNQKYLKNVAEEMVSRNANRKNTFPAHRPSDPASQLRNGRKLRPITKLEIQFTDNAMDERAETACRGDEQA
jgi:hypothetical protein